MDRHQVSKNLELGVKLPNYIFESRERVSTRCEFYSIRGMEENFILPEQMFSKSEDSYGGFNSQLLLGNFPHLTIRALPANTTHLVRMMGYRHPSIT